MARYIPRITKQDELKEGDVRRITVGKDGEFTYIGVVTRIREDTVLVKKCYSDDPKSTRYMIKDVDETGLEYAMFIDCIEWKVDKKRIGKRYGSLSKRDFRNIREMKIGV